MSSQQKLCDLFGIERPILLAPMIGPGTPELCIEVSEGGGLGSLACSALAHDDIKAQTQIIQQRTAKPFNLNFFCHTPQQDAPERDAAWKARLKPYYLELGLDPDAPMNVAARAPFDETRCELIEELRPPVVSFHFGLPAEPLLARVKATGAKVLSSATTVAEARALEAGGVDAIIAQGAEAGGHRGLFLSNDISTQPGLFALLPQVVDAVSVPVIAAGGIGDARGVAAAFVLGASGVQLGTAFMFCPEAKLSPMHLAALKAVQAEDTVLTNVLTGRPARGLINRVVREMGPMAEDAPYFPNAAAPLAPLRAAAEAKGSSDFSPLWSGQAAALSRAMPARDLTRSLMEEATRILQGFTSAE